MASTEKSPPIRVYVHLAHGKGAKQWEQQYHEGTLLGVNEIKPYGYYRASDHNCIVVYSVDAQENLIQKYFRGFLRVCLGFDFIHVFQNAKNVWNTDVIWTHTESQTLGVLFFFSIFPWHKRQ